MERLTEARSITDDALRRGVEERWEKTIAAHVAAERALADSTIASMEARLAEVESRLAEVEARAHLVEEAVSGYVEARDAMEHVRLDDFWTRIDAYRAALATLRATLFPTHTEGGG